MNATTLQTGTVKHQPGKVFPSKYEGQSPRRSVTVEWNGSMADCWFEVGSDMEFLQKGDRVMFTIAPGSNGKANATIHLTEDLALELQRRRAATMPPPPSEAPPPGEPVTPNKTLAPLSPEQRWGDEKMQAIGGELAKREKIMARCYVRLHEMLPDTPEAAIAQMAVALYQDLSKLF